MTAKTDKLRTAEAAVLNIEDGTSVMVGGFLGTGTPEILIDALVAKGPRNLTVIANDGGLPGRGVGKLLAAGMISHLIATHVGMNPAVAAGINQGTLQCTLIPQGTLAERIRAAGAGLGGILTPTGIGTKVSEGKEVIEVGGKPYLLEKPLQADFALIRASVCDTFGNAKCNLATKNFNPLMAMAARTVIMGSESVVETGACDPDTFTIPGIFVDYIVGGEQPWKI